MDIDELRASVAREFETTGAATPPWPDPYPDRDAPDDTYSRCLEPQKHSIVGARIAAWTRALTGAGLATLETPADDPALWRAGQDNRPPLLTLLRPRAVTILRPVRADATPLLFVLRSILAVEDNVLIGAGDPAVLIEQAPDCGCDHCDSGSADLLDSIDAAIAPVVDGRFVHVAGEDWTLRTTDIGWAGSGDAPGDRRGNHEAVDHLIAEARAGRSPYRVVRGASWLDD